MAIYVVANSGITVEPTADTTGEIIIEALRRAAGARLERQKITDTSIAHVLRRQNVIKERTLHVFHIFSPRLNIKQYLG